jgi:hypothetical protein
MARQHHGGAGSLRDKRVEDTGPFRHSDKHPSATRCPDCGLLFAGGAWKNPPARLRGAFHPQRCPACLQIRDGQSGGLVYLSGSFASLHRQDLLNRIRNVEKLGLPERPLERIIRIDEEGEGIKITVTTEHLAARIGKAIQRDCGGSLQLKYAPEEKYAVARWRRDD